MACDALFYWFCFTIFSVGMLFVVMCWFNVFYIFFSFLLFIITFHCLFVALCTKFVILFYCTNHSVLDFDFEHYCVTYLVFCLVHCCVNIYLLKSSSCYALHHNARNIIEGTWISHH